MLESRPLMNMEDDHLDGPGGGVDVLEKPAVKPKNKRPSLYRVLLLNDDFTPMDFVIHVLETYFHKTRDEATNIMLRVHHDGKGLCAGLHL
jgi:ATP-dependent Clp protease adaptor protein ClpS